LIFEGGLEDFEKKFPAIQGGKKKYPAAKYIGKKISCAAILQEKNICLVPLGGKKFLQSEFSNPPPQKSNGPPLMLPQH
jgi:hypothetical protein